MITKISKYLSISDDFITRDLTVLDTSPNDDEFELFFKKHKDILTDEDKEYMRFIIEKRKKDIDKQLGEE